MSSRQIYNKGESDGLSLPYNMRKRKGKGQKSSNQPEMEQQHHALLDYPFHITATHMEAMPTREGI